MGGRSSPRRASEKRVAERLGQQLLQFRTKGWRDVVAGECESDIGGQKTEAGAAIIGDAVEAHAMETLFLGERQHGVGQLYLAAGALFALLEDGENLRLENVAAGDIQVRGRCALRRLLDHSSDLERMAVVLTDRDDTVFVRLLRRDLLDRDDIAAVLFISLDALRKAARFALA